MVTTPDNGPAPGDDRSFLLAALLAARRLGDADLAHAAVRRLAKLGLAVQFASDVPQATRRQSRRPASPGPLVGHLRAQELAEAVAPQPPEGEPPTAPHLGPWLPLSVYGTEGVNRG